jgi:ABC-type glutathione transport system ATPase component
VLILDEPMTGVDMATMRELMQALRLAIKRPERTTIIVTHRMVFAGLADHVVLMSSEGTVNREGDSAVLAELKQQYTELIEGPAPKGSKLPLDVQPQAAAVGRHE